MLMKAKMMKPDQYETGQHDKSEYDCDETILVMMKTIMTNEHKCHDESDDENNDKQSHKQWGPTITQPFWDISRTTLS